MPSKGFIYSFWDKTEQLLYIGKTEGALLDRLRGHSHCPKEMYKATYSIKFFHCNNPIILDIIEKILISKLNPLYNSKDVYCNEIIEDFVKQVNFQYDFDWQELSRDIFRFNLTPLTKEEIKEKRNIGIQKAKAEGKYKGRKPNFEARKHFIELLPLNISGEKTALSICKELEISPNTFYRWKLAYEKGTLLKDDK